MKALPIKKTLTEIQKVLRIPFYNYEAISETDFTNKKFRQFVMVEKILCNSDVFKLMYLSDGTNKQPNYKRLVGYYNRQSKQSFFTQLNDVNKMDFGVTESYIDKTIDRKKMNDGKSIYDIYFKSDKAKETKAETKSNNKLWEY